MYFVLSFLAFAAVCTVPALITRFLITKHPLKQRPALKLTLAFAIFSFISLGVYIFFYQKEPAGFQFFFLWSIPVYKVLVYGPAAAEIKKRFDAFLSKFNAGMAHDVIYRVFSSYISQDSSFLYKKDPSFDEDRYCVLAIVNICYDEIASGQHHIWRGGLSPDGVAIKKLFLTALRYALSQAYVDVDTYNTQIEGLNEAEKDVG